jgi:DNA-binding MarR family transcriptional regulator
VRRMESYPTGTRTRGGDASALRSLLQTLIRSFGLLAASTTPCGKPLPVSHAHALMVLLERARLGVTPGQRELGAALGIDKSNIARLCQRMEEAGHLRQLRDREDGRARLLRLTPQGRRIAGSVELSSQAHFAALAAAVPASRRRDLLSALETLNEAIAATAHLAPGPARTSSRGKRRAGGVAP